jgi:hypothetical protein
MCIVVQWLHEVFENHRLVSLSAPLASILTVWVDTLLLLPSL